MITVLAWRNIWRNPLRSSIMILAMVFGLLGVVLMAGLSFGIFDSMVENSIKYQTAHLQVHNPRFLLNEELDAWIPDADVIANELRRQPGVAGVTARQVVDGMMASAASSRGVRINGIDPKTEVTVTAVAERITEGEYLPKESRNPILVSQRSAKKLNLRIHSKVVLTFSDTKGEVAGAAFRVCGFYDTPNSVFDESNVFVRRDDLMKYSGLNEAHEIAIRLTAAETLNEQKPKLAALVGDRCVMRDWIESQPLLSTMLQTMDFTNFIMIGIFVAALGLGIVNIMLMSVFERTREFGVLMAVGLTRIKLLGLVMLESLLLGTIGGLLGLCISAATIKILGLTGLPFGKLAEGLGVYGVDTIIYMRVPFYTYAITLAMVFGASLLAALYPARQIIKKSPFEAMAEKH